MTHFTNLFGGIVSVPLDKDLQFAEFEQSVKRAKVDAIVFDPKCIELIEQLKKDLTNHELGGLVVHNIYCEEEGLNLANHLEKEFNCKISNQ